MTASLTSGKSGKFGVPNSGKSAFFISPAGVRMRSISDANTFECGFKNKVEQINTKFLR